MLPIGLTKVGVLTDVFGVAAGVDDGVVVESIEVVLETGMNNGENGIPGATDTETEFCFNL